MRKSKIIILSLGVLLFGGLAALLFLPSIEKQIENTKRAGDLIVIELHNFHKIHGRYPKSLQEAGVKPTKTPFGYFDYSPVPSDDSFILGAGDNTVDGIRVFRASGASEWTVWE